MIEQQSSNTNNFTQNIYKILKIQQNTYYYMGTVNQFICPDDNQNEYSWCFYQAPDSLSIIVQIVFLLSLLLMLVRVTTYFKTFIIYRKIRKYSKLFGDVFLHVYILTYAWLLSSIIKVIINIYVYFSYMNSTIVPADPTSDSPIVILSAIFLILDYLCPFCLLFLMLFIPYQWTNGLLLNTSEKEVIARPIRQQINRFFTVLKGIRIYFTWIRPWFLILLIAQPFLMFFTSIQGTCESPKLNSILVYLDSIIIFAFYIFCYQVGTFMHKNQLIIVQKSDIKRIKLQFLFLFGVMLLRICLNFFFKLLSYGKYQPNSNCLNTTTDNRTPGLIFLIIAQFFMHLLPMLTILYIYRPDIQFRKRYEKILNNTWQQNEGILDNDSNYDKFSMVTNIQKSNKKQNNFD